MMDRRNALLHLREHGQTQGPFDEADVRRWLDTGELGANVMSWRAGDARWQSLGRRWPGKRRGFAPWVTLVAALMLAGSAVILAVPSWTFRLLPMEMHGAAELKGLESLLLTPALGLISVGIWRKWRRAELPKLPYVLGCFLVVLAAQISVNLTRFSVDLLAIPIPQGNALVSFNELSHDIVIQGEIGPRLASDLDFMIKSHPDAVKIVIRSLGGRLNYAERTAEVITAAHLPLQVVNHCASACALLWAMVPVREMSPGSRIGLHQAYFLVGSDPRWSKRVKAADDSAVEAKIFAGMDHAGFSARLQQIRRSTPPQKIYWVSVAMAKNEGVQFEIVAAPSWRVLY